jgi:plastocyanin
VSVWARSAGGWLDEIETPFSAQDGPFSQTGKEVVMRGPSLLTSALVLVAAVAGLRPADAGDQKAEDKKPKNHIVEMGDTFFKPKEITISVGDTITWVNKGKQTHTATSDDGKTFDTKGVKAGAQSKPVKFEQAGKFPYHCDPHEDDMKGTVIVK